jgi:UDP-N-acetylmuramoyl-L-alanyl-D-glutamate--2,6-diaminopimelate ligase
MKFRELTRLEEIGLLDYYSPLGEGEADLSSPRYDSRSVQAGDAFFAIAGFASDGHKFISSAIDRGAKTIVLEHSSEFSREEAERLRVSRIVVKNSRKALAIISEEAFGSPSSKLRLIGVTGTNGKTTVTNLIRQFLTLRGERVGLIGTIGIDIAGEQIDATHTTPESRDVSELLARMVKANVTTCVMEVSSHSLALDRVAALDFDIAVFTNLTQDHLDFHQTMENYFAAKQILFNTLKDTAVAITNANDAYGPRMIQNTNANAHTYSIANDDEEIGDLIANEPTLSIKGTSFTIRKRYSDEQAFVSSKLVGTFNAQNLMAAISALYFGVEGCSLEVLAELAPKLEPVRGRFETLQLKNGATAIVDYAHTPDALQNVLETIRSVDPSATIVTVFGCGGDRDKLKRPIMGNTAYDLSDEIIVTSDNPRSEDPNAIIREILSGIPSNDKSVTVEPDRAKAIAMGCKAVAQGGILLVAGKGHEQYQIVGNERRHFDDREELLKCSPEV